MSKQPYNDGIERVVLCECMIDNDALAHATAHITGEMFYKPNYQVIYDTLKYFYTHDIRFNQVTLADELKRQRKYDTIGGMNTINSILGETYSGALIDEHCKKLKEYYQYRQIINMCNAVSQAAVDTKQPATEIINNANALLDQISGDDTKRSFQTLKNTLMDAKNEIIADNERTGIAGIPTGLPYLDKLTNGWQNGDTIVIGAPKKAGKSFLAAQFAGESAMAGHAVGIFSLEMTTLSLTKRFIANKAKVNVFDVHYQKLTTPDIQKIDVACGKLYNYATIVFDDNAGITIEQMTAKAKLMKKLFNIDLMIVDYIQLMPSTGTESRQREVEKISHGLKNIAKQLNIPVIIVSQLSRPQKGNENKMPLMTDLRDCLALDTSLIYYKNNIQSACIYEREVVSLNKNKGDMVMSKAKYINKKSNDVYRVKTQSGRYIDCTMKHSLLTSDGYLMLRDLNKEDSLAVALNFDTFENKKYISESKFIGWMLGNGSMMGYPAPSFITNDKDVAREFCEFVFNKWGFYPKHHRHKCKKVFQYDLTYSNVRTCDPNITKTWCIEHDMWGRRSKDKYIPDWFMEQADKKSIIELMSGLWETDGSVELGKKHKRFSYSTTSVIMKDQILYLLAKIGIFAHIDDGYKSSVATTKCYKISIENKEFCDMFNSLIKMTGYKGERQKQINKTRHSNFINRLGRQTTLNLHNYIKGLCPNRIAEIQIHGNRRATKTHTIKSLNALKKYKNIKETPFDWICTKNIVWDPIDSIELIGNKDVFDLKVENTHNFIVNGLIVHNSGALEADASLVLLIYEPSQDRKAELLKEQGHDPGYSNPLYKRMRELVVAANRNGQTGAIPMVFTGEHAHFGELENRGLYANND